jgi:hypothetical protein
LFSILTFAQSSRWQQKTDFNIKVSLNDEKNTLDANETIIYTNNSPDTLQFIWFHLWPNAFKNDKTAFSEQMVNLLNNSEFYFSQKKDRGYINNLAFQVDGKFAQLEYHPQNNDVAKLLLPKPLLPRSKITISTSFHVNLPKNFSRSGYVGQSYQITQWYPKPAVYDQYGWHQMPYLEQGEFYSEFGDYNVQITLPQNYVVAATGEVQEESEKDFLLSRGNFSYEPIREKKKKDIFVKNAITLDAFPPSAKMEKTLHYKAVNVIDFAWFADKRFIVHHDTIALPTNPKIDVYTFFLPSKKELWNYSTDWVKRAVRFYSAQLGDYPYPVVNAVCSPSGITRKGMEYPNVTSVNVSRSPQELDMTLAFFVGHNWLQSIIANNEHNHAWMDEGMNTFYKKKYWKQYYSSSKENQKKLINQPEEAAERLLMAQISENKDQPIETNSEDLTENNYAAVVYSKGALFLEKLEKLLGTNTMENVMHQYFKEWSFHHPYPEDFKKTIEATSGRNLDSIFQLLHKTGSLDSTKPPKANKVTGPLPKFDGKAKYNAIIPAIGYNSYDNLMVGTLLSNINHPIQKFEYIAAPLYAFGSKQFNYIGSASYAFYPKKNFYSVIPAINVAKFNTEDGIGQNYKRIYRGFRKIVPSIRFTFKKESPVSNVEKWIELKTFLITENNFDYKQRRFPQDTLSYYANKSQNLHREVIQIGYNIQNTRHLYPYQLYAQLQQTGDVLRATITSNYFFNFNYKQQGINVRLFAGKIFYTKPVTQKVISENARYDFTMYPLNGSYVDGASGSSDYTYSYPFIERNQSTSFVGRQIMIRDGGFKYRTDYSGTFPGRSNDWLASANFTIDLPNNVNPLAVLPLNVPLKIFTDIGTSAPAWVENYNSPKFLYSVGLQLPILKYINVYWAIFQSSAFKEANSNNATKWWQKRITFNIEIQNIKSKFYRVHL